MFPPSQYFIEYNALLYLYFPVCEHEHLPLHSKKAQKVNIQEFCLNAISRGPVDRYDIGNVMVLS